MAKKYTETEILEELKRVNKLLDHAPSFEDMKKFGKISPATCVRQFGTWERVKRQIGWKPKYETFIPNNVSVADGAWLSGLIDGEGCFRIMKPSPRSGRSFSHSFAPVFTMSLRTDDLPMLQEFQRIIGTNRNYHLDSRNACIKNGMKANPAYKINLRDLPTLLFHLVPILEHFPLRSKKKYELRLFKLALNILYEKWNSGNKNKGYTDSERLALHNLYKALGVLKQFNSSYDEVVQAYDIQELFLNYKELSKGMRYKKGTTNS